MSHKRPNPHVSAPPAKRRSQATPKSKRKQPKNPPKTTTQHIYLAIEEEYGPYMQTAQNIFEAYAAAMDAN